MCFLKTKKRVSVPRIIGALLGSFFACQASDQGPQCQNKRYEGDACSGRGKSVRGVRCGRVEQVGLGSEERRCLLESVGDS